MAVEPLMNRDMNFNKQVPKNKNISFGTLRVFHAKTYNI
jgi:hypothetical protein